MVKSAKNIAENCSGKEVNDQSLEIEEQFCYLDWTRVTEGAIHNVITRIRSWWNNFRDLVPLLTRRTFFIRANTFSF